MSTEKQATIYAFMRSGLPDVPVLMERGNPQYMALFDQTTDEGVNTNWYGLMADRAELVRLGHRVDEGSQSNEHVWTYAEAVFGNEDDPHHYSPGDIFATAMVGVAEGVEVEEASFTFQELLEKTLAELRALCRENGVDYYNAEPRTQLAMMLFAPVPQELSCPDCKAKTAGRHMPVCHVAQCIYTGKPRGTCNRKHAGVSCGYDYWTGYMPGVLESYVYNVTPEEILANGTWDFDQGVFVYVPEGEPQDVDETYTEPEQIQSVEDVNDLLAGLRDKSVQTAITDDYTRQTAEEIGVSIEQRSEGSPVYAVPPGVDVFLDSLETGTHRERPERQSEIPDQIASEETSEPTYMEEWPNGYLHSDSDAPNTLTPTTDTPDTSTGVTDPYSGQEG